MALGSRQFSFDRFIPRRPNIRLEATFDLINTSDSATVCNKYDFIEDDTFVNTAKQRYCRENYRKFLKEAMFFEKYNIFELSNFHKKKPTGKEISHWPVKPRNKPLLPGSPSMLLDLPDLDMHYCRNVVDWGKSGYIGTIYDYKIHLWHPEKNIRIQLTDISGNIVENCIKWNADGSKLSTALVGGSLAVYNMQLNKTTHLGTCPCRLTPMGIKKMCSIISAEWTKSNYILTGCSKGTLTRWLHNLNYSRFRYRAHVGDITKLILSCKEKYIATTGIDNNLVIWTYHEIEQKLNIKCILPTKAIAWHPWKDSLLVVGDVDRFYLWNVQNMNMLRSIKFENSYIDCLAFNPLSAELLLSVTFCENDDREMSYLKVMKNLDQVVDEVRCNEFRIPYLLWDHTGTKLGTASTEESFCIWNFFGRTTKEEKKFLKKEKQSFPAI
ncbi:protein cortex-like [Diorhabda sublineata]|uniref:protein cortex-like n=1 Tax=Diorhabda sublineata TaxID=1163346 RepID=UPI0024E05F76|nr:protein cortex-like [Diorhabda sublineata]